MLAIKWICLETAHVIIKEVIKESIGPEIT